MEAPNRAGAESPDFLSSTLSNVQSSPSCASPINANSTLNSFRSNPALSCPGCDTISRIRDCVSFGNLLSPSSFSTVVLLSPLPARSPDSNKAS